MGKCSNGKFVKCCYIIIISKNLKFFKMVLFKFVVGDVKSVEESVFKLSFFGVNVILDD